MTNNVALWYTICVRWGVVYLLIGDVMVTKRLRVVRKQEHRPETIHYANEVESSVPSMYDVMIGVIYQKGLTYKGRKQRK